MTKFADLLGLTLVAVDADVGVDDVGDEIRFTTSEGRVFKQWHNLHCCEDVRVDDICGDWANIIGSPILQAEESTGELQNNLITGKYLDFGSWTFYRLATIKGYVTIRWVGESNGNYSESVEFTEAGA